MIELVFMACLSATPQICEERAMPIAEVANPAACLVSAQPRLAEWVEGHPKWRITRWKCRSTTGRAVDI